MQRPFYTPSYTKTENSQGYPLRQSASASQNYEVYAIDNSELLEIPSNNQSVAVQQSSSLTVQICFIFGVFVLLAAIAAIVTSVILFKNQTSSASSSSNVTTTAAAITTITTTALYSCSNFTITMNWDYPNNDIVSTSPMTFAVCCAWCLSTSTCTVFVYTIGSSMCWLKTSIGSGGGALANDVACRM